MNYETAELWEAMKASKYRDTLDELAIMINSAKSMDEVMKIMIDATVDAVHAEAGTLWFYDYHGTGKVIPKAVYGGGEIGNFRLEPGEGVAGGVIKDGKPVMVADCQRDPRWARKVDAKTGFTTRSMICVPLISENSSRAFGSIQIINKADGSLFDDKDLQFAIKLSAELSRLYAERPESELPDRITLMLDAALLQDDEAKAAEFLQSRLDKYKFDAKDSRKILKHFLTVYRLVNK